MPPPSIIHLLVSLSTINITSSFRIGGNKRDWVVTYVSLQQQKPHLYMSAEAISLAPWAKKRSPVWNESNAILAKWPTVSDYALFGKKRGNKARTAEQEQARQSHTEWDMILEITSSSQNRMYQVFSHVCKERSECYYANFQNTFKPPDKAIGSSLTLTYRFIISCIKCPERRAKGTSHSLLQKVILIICLQHSWTKERFYSKNLPSISHYH